MTSERNDYVRVNSDFSCGGSSCHDCRGPVGDRCGAEPACIPVRLGNAWVCTREGKQGPCASGPLSDGRCCLGPATCQPHRNLRAHRRVFVISCLSLTIGGLIWILSSDWRAEFIAPGPLTSAHAQVLKGHGIARCAACHEAADLSVTQWFTRAVANRPTTTTNQTELCLKCHDQQFDHATALAPHNVPAATLEATTQRLAERHGGTQKLFPVSHVDRLACSTCHREHHGAEVSLSRLTDRQCQACHVTSFNSFETDHSEFPDAWPARRRNRIAFDHATHALNHFAEKGQSFNCNRCHVSDNLQNVQLLAAYETTCFECHDQQIRDNGSGPLSLVQLPMIDIKALADAGCQTPWPPSAIGDFDGRIPPLMRVLLAADPETAATLESLGQSFEFGDVDPQNASQVRLTAKLAKAIVQLLRELRDDPVASIRTRLAAVLGAPEAKDLDSFVATLPVPLIQATAQQWLASMDHGTPVSLDGADKLLPSPLVANASFPVAGSFAVGRSVPDRQMTAEDGRPTWNAPATSFPSTRQDPEVLAVNPLKSLLQNKKSDANPTQTPAATGSTSKGASPSLNANTTQPPRPDDQIPADELLAENPLKKLRGSLSHPHANDDTENKTALSTPSPETSPHPQAVTSQTQAAERDKPFTSSTAASHQSSGGHSITIDSGSASTAAVSIESARDNWFVNPVTLEIAYRPQLHADPVLMTVLNLVSQSNSAQRPLAAQQLFTAITGDLSVGSCAKCHTVDANGNADHVNWRAAYRDPLVRTFTSFSHRPHLIDSETRDCTSCHRLNTTIVNAADKAGNDPNEFLPDFLPITKSECATCHRRGLADNSCTGCHNYHIGSRVSVSAK